MAALLIAGCDNNGSHSYSDSSSSQTELSRASQKMSEARGVDASSLTSASEHYGYTPEDQEYIKSTGMSEKEMRAAELTICASGGEC